MATCLYVTENGNINDKCVEMFKKHEIKIKSYMSTHLDMITSELNESNYEILLMNMNETEKLFPYIKLIRKKNKQIFICIFNHIASSIALLRYKLFKEGVNMVTESLFDLEKVIILIKKSYINNKYTYKNETKYENEYEYEYEYEYEQLKKIQKISNNTLPSRKKNLYTCPICNRSNLTEDEIWIHCPLYHINEINVEQKCPICKQISKGPFQVHLRNAHGPPGRGDMHSEYKNNESSLYSFALVVCYNPKLKKFLLVQEFANSGYWLPGGRIDSEEDPKEAAIRETKEEAGIDIKLTGFIRIEYTPKHDYHREERDKKKSNHSYDHDINNNNYRKKKDTNSNYSYVRMRFIFTAEPIDYDQLPKSIPDYESVGATWCSLEEVKELPLRGGEPITYFNYFNKGKIISPITSIVTPADYKN